MEIAIDRHIQGEITKISALRLRADLAKAHLSRSTIQRGIAADLEIRR